MYKLLLISYVRYINISGKLYEKNLITLIFIENINLIWNKSNFDIRNIYARLVFYIWNLFLSFVIFLLSSFFK